jgi:hypothetical protein
MTEPRLQHYVPRFYLSGFADPGILRLEGKHIVWVYERGRQPRRSSPKNEARERDFYTYHDEDARNIAAEQWFANLENDVAPIIASLEKDRRHVTKSEKELLALFLGTMQMRTPAGRYLSENRIDPFAKQMLRVAAGDAETFRTFVEENDLLPYEGVDAEEIRQGILAGHAESLYSREALNLASIIEIGKMVAQMLIERNWQTIYSEDQELFLTSDDPVVTHALDCRSNKLHLRMGVAAPGVNMWFPLCRTVCLRVLKDGESGYGRWTNAGIRHVNKMTIMSAHRWVFAPERSEKIKSLFDKKGGQFDVRTADFHFNGQTY